MAETIDEYIPSNITSYIIDFFKRNLTDDIFNIENYNKIKNLIGLDGNLTTIMNNGIFILTLFIGSEDILEIKFEEQYFDNLLKKKKTFSLKIGQFILLSALYYFCNKIDYKVIISYAYDCYYKLIYGSDK